MSRCPIVNRPDGGQDATHPSKNEASQGISVTNAGVGIIGPTSEPPPEIVAYTATFLVFWMLLQPIRRRSTRFRVEITCHSSQNRGDLAHGDTPSAGFICPRQTAP
jgi:hypothetical protein